VRSGRLVAELEIGMEGGEVEGDVGARWARGSIRRACGFGGMSFEGGMMRLVISNQTGFVFEPGEHVRTAGDGESDFA